MFKSMENPASRKRRRNERAFSFHTFGDPGCPSDYDGPFRDNVRAFLQNTAERELYDVEGRPAWSIVLQVDDSHTTQITLVVVEEDIQNSRHPHCDHCRCIGWSHHLVSNRRYHFIIPAPEIGDRPLGVVAGAASGKVCPNCHDPIALSAYTCLTCNVEAVQGSILDLQSHLLHGVLHCNGFGHLLCVNGREKGSRLASGREIVDLWDRLCAMLRARKVSVEDLAKKRTLEFRLLHCVAYGDSWFGRWGYKFGHGSFGITQQMYAKAIEAIRGMPLNVMVQHFEGVDQDVISVVSMYQRISGQALQTVGDLVRFMMELKARLPLHPTTNTSFPRISFSRDHDRKGANSNGSGSGNNNSSGSEMPCRWSVKRLELATQVIVEALKNCEKKWMPRQDVRDAARVYIGDTGLLDFVLKSLGNRVVGGHVVRRAVNPITKVLEYSLEDVNGGAIPSHGVGNRGDSKGDLDSSTVCEVGRAEVLRDIAYIYRHVLECYKPARRGLKNVLTAIPTAARIILDTKQMMKDYRGELTRKCANTEWGMDDDEMLRVMCTVEVKEEDIQLMLHQADDGLLDDVLDVLLSSGSSASTASSVGSGTNSSKRSPPPAELIVLPPHASVSELKREAERAFRDTYFIMREFKLEGVPSLEGVDDDDLLFGNIESGSHIVVQGSGVDVGSDLRYEGGSDNWVVDCPCGTKDDDGERMIACDVCEVWQHTRCGNIADSDAIPQRFLCSNCSIGFFKAML
ncbi:hypothetical protein GOP47_0004309 [Adiantum capillus-veneris]|uniref:Zinc finger PHD-type domain-containing protein n=1 Tax=Adiantum capillus-veneris TaxID=13818 RepID=A0A9D4V8F6_ADICA|nr:hypothetical protein GOP47_0004309 [Adiantum capillus-veneris]